MQRKTASRAVFLFERKSVIPKFPRCAHPATIKAVITTRKKRHILNKITLALTIANPGHLRNSIQSLLRSIPQIEVLAESNDPSILSKVSEEIHPDLIVIDAAIIDSESWANIANLKADRPGIKVLALTDNDDQGRRAKEAGADYSLVKGFPAMALATLIETSLIHDSENVIS